MSSLRPNGTGLRKEELQVRTIARERAPSNVNQSELGQLGEDDASTLTEGTTSNRQSLQVAQEVQIQRFHCVAAVVCSCELTKIAVDCQVGEGVDLLSETDSETVNLMTFAEFVSLSVERDEGTHQLSVTPHPLGVNMLTISANGMEGRSVSLPAPLNRHSPIHQVVILVIALSKSAGLRTTTHPLPPPPIRLVQYSERWTELLHSHEGMNASENEVGTSVIQVSKPSGNTSVPRRRKDVVLKGVSKADDSISMSLSIQRRNLIIRVHAPPLQDIKE